MTTIAPFAAGSYASSRGTSQLVSLKSQLTDLTTQLSSGLTAQSYGGLGNGRTAALSAQASISALNGYSAVIDTAQTRAKLGTTSLSQIVTVATQTNATLQNGLQSTSTDTQAAKSTALNNFNAVLDALNQSDGSVYLFGGTKGATPPVLDAETILYGGTNANGVALDGLSTLTSEQVTADVGPQGNGRLTQSVAGNTVSLTEGAAARAAKPNGAFGFSIAGVTSSNTAAFTGAQGGTPVTTTITGTAQPSVGDTVTVQLKLPDGSATSVTLKAAASADATSTTTFAIGGSLTDTVANLSKSLGNALQNAASTTLSANATARTSADFFAASSDAGTTPERVYYDASGTPSYVHTAASTTAVKQSVVWYNGQKDDGTSARASQTYQVGSSATVQLGARANEAPIQKVLAGLATVALGMPAGGTTGTNSDAYAAVVAQATPLLGASNTSPSVQDIATDFSLASARMTNAASTNTAQKSTLQDTVDGIEQASTEEVATRLLDLQNRLQASYQITASLSKLSLVNYIS
ncbi:flagellin [Methylobacterium sp. J-076]|uniref:flagellin n=1 Tax=Methylobacterium sp. J-076 TaxID=2836655 RepID=UPI001FB9C4BD|nr:flagellin [Methylobacterium sp. J-076]MCJ2015362.1 flagellin [Methylobacterium sp. J-076]